MDARPENSLDLRAMVVDDDKPVRRLIALALADAGCAVAEAGTGAEALAIARLDPLDLVVVDVGLPDADGLELTRKLRCSPMTAAAPIVVVSGSDPRDITDAALRAGATDVLAKPFGFGELKARFARLVRARVLNRAAAERLARLEALDELKTSLHQMLVHDQGNLVTGLLGYLDLLGAEGLSPDQRRTVKTAAGVARELRDMTADLLDIDRLEERRLPVAREPLCLSSIIESAIDEARALAGAARKVAYARPDRLPLVCGDTPVLRRVLRNLLMNSLQHGERGGVMVTAAAERPDLVAVAVEDDGPGVPAALREKVFDKFGAAGVRAAGVRRGRGLGLAFSRLAARAHGGDLVIEDRAGGLAGARFVLRLPAGERVESPPWNPSPPPGGSSPSRCAPRSTTGR